VTNRSGAAVFGRQKIK